MSFISGAGGAGGGVRRPSQKVGIGMPNGVSSRRVSLLCIASFCLGVFAVNRYSCPSTRLCFLHPWFIFILILTQKKKKWLPSFVPTSFSLLWNCSTKIDQSILLSCTACFHEFLYLLPNNVSGYFSLTCPECVPRFTFSKPWEFWASVCIPFYCHVVWYVLCPTVPRFFSIPYSVNLDDDASPVEMHDFPIHPVIKCERKASWSSYCSIQIFSIFWINDINSSVVVGNSI